MKKRLSDYIDKIASYDISQGIEAERAIRKEFALAVRHIKNKMRCKKECSHKQYHTKVCDRCKRNPVFIDGTLVKNI